MPRGFYKRKPNLETFWGKVKKQPSGCWEWLGSTDKDGYGRHIINRVGCRAHRYSYEIHKGSIPEGLVVRHTCHNPKCVNPKHLLTGTQAQNIQDSINSKRSVKGNTHGMSLINTDQAKNIKKLLKEKKTAPYIHKVTGVSLHIIYHIKGGKIWVHA